MSDASTGSERATGDASTPLEERAFGEAGSSFEAHARLRQSATARQRNWRRNKGMGLGVRPVRLSRKEAQKLVELGYLSLESKGDPKKEGVAIEAYLGDSLYASGKIFHERSLGERQVQSRATLPPARAGDGEDREHLQDGLHEAPEYFE